MRHDRHLEEPPEHPDDCGCRDCREETTAMLIAEDETEEYDSEKHGSFGEWAGPDGLDRLAEELEKRVPVNDTHLCSGGPEEITDEEWERWRAERSAAIERMANAGAMPEPEDDDG